MTENISIYIKELKNIEKNGDRDLTTKYDHLYHIINQSKDAETIKEAFSVIDNIKKTTIKSAESYVKKPMQMVYFFGSNVCENYSLRFPERIEDESEVAMWYFILKNTYNEIVEYYTSMIRYCRSLIKGKDDIFSQVADCAIRNHPILSCHTDAFIFSPLTFNDNAPITSSHYKYEEKDDKDLYDKYLELRSLYKELELDFFHLAKYYDYTVNDELFANLKVFFGDFEEDDDSYLIEDITDRGAEYLEEYSDDCNIIAYKDKKNLPDLKKKYAKNDLLFISYEDLRDIF